MSHGRGAEENTAIYSIIFFPSQSPFIDFKDKGAGSALKMDEKLSAAEMDILPILPVNSSSFHNFCFIWLSSLSLSLKSLRHNLFQIHLKYNLFSFQSCYSPDPFLAAFFSWKEDWWYFTSVVLRQCTDFELIFKCAFCRHLLYKCVSETTGLTIVLLLYKSYKQRTEL